MPEELTPLPCPLESSIDAYIDDYAMECDGGSHHPSEADKCVIKDAIMGLLVDDDFLAAWNRRAQPEPAASSCDCRACIPPYGENVRFVVCANCGNKRCPHATDHRNTCTNSNEPGQPGSVFGAMETDAAPSVAPEPPCLSDDDLRDLADSACQEALSFGVGVDAFLRLAHTVRSRAAHPPRAPSVAPEPPNPWKDAVIDGLVVSWVLKDGHETNPRQALADLIGASVMQALDPAISKQARDMQALWSLVEPTRPERR